MPIDYKSYHPKWSLISRLIRFSRAKNKCEWCGAPNYSVRRLNKESAELEYPCGTLYLDKGALEGFGCHHDALIISNFFNGMDDGLGKWVIVVLTVAHIDHDKTNNRFDNLAALCQRCHLGHDKHQHLFTRNKQLGLW